MVLVYPQLFYPQDWYYDEDFAYALAEHVQGAAFQSAAYWACDYINSVRTFYGGKGASYLAQKYIWTSDHDSRGDRIYVGGWDLGRKKGFQIHRHLTIDPEQFVNRLTPEK